MYCVEIYTKKKRTSCETLLKNGDVAICLRQRPVNPRTEGALEILPDSPNFTGEVAEVQSS